LIPISLIYRENFISTELSNGINFEFIYIHIIIQYRLRGRRDRMVVGFTTTDGISGYHYHSCEFESQSQR